MFDFVVQVRDDFIYSVFNELARTGRPFLQDTLDEVAPIQIGSATVEPIINLTDDDIGVSLDSSDQMVELSLASLPVQLNAQNLEGIGDALIEGDVSMLLRLPISSQETGGYVRAGIDTNDLGPENVLINLDAGHPLEDEELVIELLDRMVQNLFEMGEIPATQNFMGESTPIAGTLIDAFVRFVNDIGDVDGRRATVQSSAQAGHVQITLPLELWVNTVDAATQVILEHLEFDADVHIDVPVVIDLLPDEGESASIEMALPNGQVSVTIGEVREGQEQLDNPFVRAAVETFIASAANAALAGPGVRRVDVFTLDEVLELLRSLVLNALTSPPRFIQFWEAPVSQETADIVVRIIDDLGGGQILAIGINAGPGANLFSEEPMIPAGRDFAVRLSDDALIDELNANLVAPSEYDDIDGDLTVFGFAEAGASEITVTGFDDAGGTFRRNTRFRLDGFVYTVTVDADIGANDDGAIVAQLLITPELQTVVGLLGADDTIDVLFGVGLPRTEDAGGNERTFRINDDMTATFEDGAIRLAGTGRLRRPNALFLRTVNVSIAMSLGLHWASTARVSGGDQTGDELSVEVLSPTLRTFPDNSLIIIDNEDEPRRVTGDAERSGNSATLELAEALEVAPDDQTMISLRWKRVGRTAAGDQTGNTLQVADMVDGAGLIPGGARISIDGDRFVIDSDATIADDGTVTLTLTEALTEEFDDGPPDEAPIRIYGGWDGRGVVDGADQTGTSLQLTGVVRTIPDNTTLTIGGMPGLFTVDGTTEIVDNEATLTLRHAVLEQLSDLIDVDDDELWNRIGQPAEGASVRRRDGGQAPDLRLIGDPEVVPNVDLGDLFGAIIGAILGVLLTFLTAGGLLLGVVAGLVVGFVVRAIADRIVGGLANGEAEDALNVVAIPFPDQLSQLGVAVDAIFNNPIEISPEGLIVAGRAVASSVFPDLAESTADANGPYEFRAGMVAEFGGGTLAPLTTYSWRSGDGAALAGLDPSHTYPQQGSYVADLSSVDNQLGLEIQTRELATVVVKNTRPVASALPLIEGFEGEEVEIELPFADMAWLDAHDAFVDWGDGTLPTIAEVTEILGPPQTTGMVTARHTYCDNGVYVVTVILTDAPGGEARVLTEAHIANVAPVVDAGPDVYAHPCVTTRLIGHFTDQGWCDTHTGVWDFGDCSPVADAFIEETNDAPQAEGTAVAMHCYERCGTYVASLTITDDDGASTTESRIVRYSDLANGSFEEGFETQRFGNVGRHWDGYASAQSTTAAPQQVFDCESCVVCDGQRSQAISGLGSSFAGLRQQIGVNRSWEYQVEARVQVTSRDSSVWLGLDSAGGTNRNAETIVWRHVNGAHGWQRLTSQTVAEGDVLSVFLELRDGRADPAFVDCIELRAFPCVVEEKPEEPEDVPPNKECVDWAECRPGTRAAAAIFGSWHFATESGGAMRIVTFGAPADQPKLSIPDQPDALNVEFDEAQQVVRAQVDGPPGSMITLTGLSLGGAVIATDQSATGGMRSLEVQGPEIARVRLESDFRGTIIELCAERAGSISPTVAPVLVAEPRLPLPG